MKYVKDADDCNIEKQDMSTNRVLQHLRDINFYKFSVGDILIREDKYGDNWKVKIAACGLPYKYVYVFENDLGVGYIRRLSVSGEKFVEMAVCVVNFDPRQTRFQLDQAYADHILLAADGDELDIKSAYSDNKKRREQIHRKNKKATVKINNKTDAYNFLKSLKPGDPFWFGWSVRSIRKEPYVVARIVLTTNPDDSVVEYTVSGQVYSSYYVPNLNMDQLIGGVVFLNKPTFIDEEL